MEDNKPNLYIKPEGVTMLVREKFPSSIKAELVSDTLSPSLEVKETTPFSELKIVGGEIHSFVEGWKFAPYRLVKQIGKIIKYTNGSTLTCIEKEIILDSLSEDIKEIPNKIKEEWERRVEEYYKGVPNGNTNKDN